VAEKAGSVTAERKAMELYYKDLISEDASLEKLVDDLMLIVQGADEFIQTAGANLTPEHKQEITTRLQQLKEGCRQVKQKALSSARAVDKVMHQYPYSVAGFSFGLGLLVGALMRRR
jgi:ElaB/YqjD/DUF883 family membrane-anchored ribosome-binding protein